MNKRLVYTMRALGQGYSAVKNFTSLMNMPNPMTANNYDKIIGNVTVVVKSIARQIMRDACDDIKNKNTDMENGVTDIATLYVIDVYKIIH